MDRLLDILTELHDDVDFENCIDLIDGGVFDSFDIVALIADISSEFEIDIPAEDIIPENFNSAKAIYALIERLIEEQ